MHAKLLVLIFVLCLQHSIVAGQRVWVSPTTTAQEMRNPYTWYRPFYQAAAEAYGNYFQNSREITNQLYQQAYLTGAWGRPNGNGGGGGNGGNGNGGQIAGNPGGTAGGVTGGTTNQNWG